MVKIHKNNIRMIRVYVRRGCNVYITTPAPKKLKSWQTISHFISFYAIDVNDKHTSVYYGISKSGKSLDIYINYSKDDKAFLYTPNSFRISLPPGCHLNFLYID